MAAGIAIVGMTTAARQLLDAAALMRTDESAALDRLADAIAVAQEAYRAGSGNQSAVMPV
jgi:hypothetical protein